ncbi:MAG: carboxypeptidase-like regulatory domain-containing protein, partial [Gemmatimonadaceae bacterium]|nr:carboxypeptidase-like regulatory domain-containing protein [Chitinophagaceae bacterium]
MSVLGSSVSAQQSLSNIYGSVTEKGSNTPIEFATAELIRLPDSTVVQGTASDRKGKFNFEQIAFGTYRIKLSFIGFEDHF